MAKATVGEIRKALLKELPRDGSRVGNQWMRDRIADRLGSKVAEDDYLAARDALVDEGKVAIGRGRGGSVCRVDTGTGALTLETQVVPEEAKRAKPRQAAMPLGPRKPGVPTKTAKRGHDSAKVLSYRHDQKRRNNPDVGVVTPETDPEQPKTTWKYDPHIDPALQFDVGRAAIERLIEDALDSGDEAAMRDALTTLKRMAEPYLNWTGKAERTSFEVDTVSLHVHERIDPATILAVVKKRMKEGKSNGGTQSDMFRAWFEEPLPYREAIEFYKHDRGWSNRLITGDSLLVMNSLLQKEGMAGQVQMIYIDPPYGIKYGSNFQPFVNKRDVKDRKDEDLTQEPEMIKAFRDTWELGIHSYLTYLRDRLLLATELLHESGSVFVQISDENACRVQNVLDDILGSRNFCAIIPFKKTGGQSSTTLPAVNDFLIWYAKDVEKVKYRQLFFDKVPGEVGATNYTWLELASGMRRPLTREEVSRARSEAEKVFQPYPMFSEGPSPSDKPFEWRGIEFEPSRNSHWKTTAEGLRRLSYANRLLAQGKTLRMVNYHRDYPVTPITNIWLDTQISGFNEQRIFVVQTLPLVIERCVLMTSDPGDLVLDPTCGSGTTAFVAEKWGRRWITCDTSRVATTLAKQRLITANYDYYQLKYPHEGLRGGFIYRTVPHVTLKSIANNPEVDEIWSLMHSAVDQALASLNAALASTGARFSVTEGVRRGEELDFARGGALNEWEVPFDFPLNWKPAARKAFEAFQLTRLAIQRRMDESIAAHAEQETLFDQPQVARDKLRVTGPFTVEAVPFPTVLALDNADQVREPDLSIARSGESLRQHTWRDELLKTGIRGKGGQMLRFAELEPLPDTKHLHCTGHLDSGERVVVSFGPEHAALEQRQVEMAIREAGELFPRPRMIVFCAFAFDPEAAKDIDALKGVVALKAQMNTDLLTNDLKKARASNQSFWLMGQPEVEVRKRKDGQYEVEVHGFDYFDTAKGELVSGGKGKIAAWMLDTDYDERSLYPRQVFFPMAGAKDGWNKLKRDIKAELDESRLDRLHGTVSLPFVPSENRRVAVKIVDDRGIESLKVVALD